jgi:hypothetical protein
MFNLKGKEMTYEEVLNDYSCIDRELALEVMDDNGDNMASFGIGGQFITSYYVKIEVVQ